MVSADSNVHIAIVGSGPSGCYSAQFLLRALPQATITIFDQLPVPYGLVRYGVAADHQGTKAVTRQFDRLFQDERVHFVGNVSIGADLPLQTLRDSFHTVILATGLYGDRSLEIPGEELHGVIRAGALTRAINGHPDVTPQPDTIGTKVAIIGQGNVAIDIARYVTKAHDEFDGSDLDHEVLDLLRPKPATEVHLVGRSPIVEAKFDPVMAKELAQQTSLRFVFDAEDLTSAAKDLERIEAETGTTPKEAQRRFDAVTYLAELDRSDATTSVHFHFGATPHEINGADDHVNELVITHSSGDQSHLIVDTVITSIGFQSDTYGTELCTSQYPHADLDRGVLADHLFCTGWLRRGPRGTIPENRKDAQMVVDTVVQHLNDAELEEKPGFASLKQSVQQQSTDFDGWLRINEHEIASAGPSRSRKKVRDRDALIQIARNA